MSLEKIIKAFDAIDDLSPKDDLIYWGNSTDTITNLLENQRYRYFYNNTTGKANNDLSSSISHDFPETVRAFQIYEDPTKSESIKVRVRTDHYNTAIFTGRFNSTTPINNILYLINTTNSFQLAGSSVPANAQKILSFDENKNTITINNSWQLIDAQQQQYLVFQLAKFHYQEFHLQHLDQVNYPDQYVLELHQHVVLNGSDYQNVTTIRIYKNRLLKNNYQIANPNDYLIIMPNGSMQVIACNDFINNYFTTLPYDLQTWSVIDDTTTPDISTGVFQIQGFKQYSINEKGDSLMLFRVFRVKDESLTYKWSTTDNSGSDSGYIEITDPTVSSNAIANTLTLTNTDESITYKIKNILEKTTTDSISFSITNDQVFPVRCLTLDYVESQSVYATENNQIAFYFKATSQNKNRLWYQWKIYQVNDNDTLTDVLTLPENYAIAPVGNSHYTIKNHLITSETTDATEIIFQIKDLRKLTFTTGTPINYRIILTAEDQLDTQYYLINPSDPTQKYLTFEVNQKPVVTLQPVNDYNLAFQTNTINLWASIKTNDEITDYAWEVNKNGVSITGPLNIVDKQNIILNPLHVDAGNGNYEITLSITTAEGATISEPVEFIIHNTPEQKINIMPIKDIYLGSSIFLIATDNTGSLLPVKSQDSSSRYYWKIIKLTNDPKEILVNHFNEMNNMIEYTLHSKGSYTVELEVVNNQGRKSSARLISPFKVL